MTVRTDDRKQFLFDVFVTAVEGGIGYWSQLARYHNSTDGLDRDHDAIEDFFALIESNDEEGWGSPDVAPDVGLKIDAAVIARGIGLFVRYVRGTDDGKPLSSDHYWRRFLEANDTNGADGDYDSDVADAIVQFGLFGEVVYG